MAKKRSLSDLSFDYSEDGELELVGFDEDDVFEEEEELEGEVEDAEEIEEEEEEEDDEEVEVPDLASRVDGLERTLQGLPQMISTAIANAISKTKDKDEEEDIPDELDNKQMVNILAKRMEKAVDKRFSGMMEENQEALRQARVTAEFQKAAAKYGTKFTQNMVPVAKVIARVEKGGGKITAEDAYLSLVDAGAIGKTQSAKSKTGKVPKEVRVGADSKNNVGEITPRPKFNSKKIKEMSDTDVFQQAFNSTLLSMTKRGRRAG